MTISKPIDDTLLLIKIARQEQTALSNLYDRYASVLYALAFKILESVQEAEEVVLEVFCQVWQTAGSYNDNSGRVDTWLFTMTRDRSLEKLKTLVPIPQTRTSSSELSTSQPNAETVIQERRDRTLRALQQLSQEQRQILELAYYQGLTHLEIALQLGKPVETIKTQIRLGLSKLHKLLGDTRRR
jgi:RNA polymerase sigma factor (sigma-70 family)